MKIYTIFPSVYRIISEVPYRQQYKVSHTGIGVGNILIDFDRGFIKTFGECCWTIEVLS